MRVHWTAKRSNQSFLKEINPEYSLEGLMLKLKLQYLGHLIGRIDSLEKAMMLGKIEGKRRKGCEVRVVVHFFFFPHEDIQPVHHLKIKNYTFPFEIS